MHNKTKKETVDFYRSLLLIRRTEEAIAKIYWSDKIKSPVHLSIGQEAVSVGVCEALRQEDAVFGTYRGHALYLAKGGNLNAMIAELFGRDTGFAHGKAGSMHLMDNAVNMIGTSAIVASSVPVALGYSYAQKRGKKNGITVIFTGEGALDEGVYSESLNFARLNNLPVLFVCENNGYAIYSPVRNRMATGRPSDRAQVFGIPSAFVANNNCMDIYHATVDAVGKIRNGEGPQFLECETYRYRDHVGPDNDRHIPYREEKELDDWIEKDELVRLKSLIESSDQQQIEADVKKQIEQAFQKAEQDSDPSTDRIMEHVMAGREFPNA